MLLAFSDEDTVMAGGDTIWLKHCPGTKHPGVKHVTIKGVGHFLQDGGADQLIDVINNFIKATPPSLIEPLRASPLGGKKAILAKEKAESDATILAVNHGDKGISTPSDGGTTYISETPMGRKPYQ